MKTLIIDDLPKNHSILKELLRHCNQQVELVGSAYSIEEGIKMVEELDPDLLFLDIQFPKARLGFELLEAFEEFKFQVIFVSGHPKHGVNAVRFGALDYLLKPIALDRLQEALRKAKKQFLKKQSTATQFQVLLEAFYELKGKKLPSRIGISTQDGIFFKEVKDIVRLEAKESYTNIVFTPGQKEILASINLGEYEEQFKSYPEFMRVHRSYMVNLKYVEVYVKADGGYLKLKNGEEVDVSRRYRDELIARLSEM
ncbi:MAG: LytTR family DNA-binding domain-containing protein [Saprospiraceae bacterium]|nr:LytTR family DNA-binding domain-containing protein [Saprospiraceae bacterium]